MCFFQCSFLSQHDLALNGAKAPLSGGSVLSELLLEEDVVVANAVVAGVGRDEPTACPDDSSSPFNLLNEKVVMQNVLTVNEFEINFCGPVQTTS